MWNIPTILVANDAGFTLEIFFRNRHVEINIHQQDDSFHQQIGLKFKEELSEVLHFEHSIIWC